MSEKKIKYMDTIHATSLREMVFKINDAGIQKEDIVQVISGDDGFFLLYYK